MSKHLNGREMAAATQTGMPHSQRRVAYSPQCGVFRHTTIDDNNYLKSVVVSGLLKMFLG